MPRLASTLLLLAALAGLAIGQPKPENWPIGARIPAISGRVVDAITGAPIPNVDVTLHANLLGGNGFLRYENQRSSSEGAFSFPTSLESATAGPLSSIEAYWLNVNRTFGPQPRATDFSWEIAYYPLFNFSAPSNFRAGSLVTDKTHFPMAVNFNRACASLWIGGCINLGETSSITIPLIPTLDHPEDCAKIADRSLAAGCRQLNTYRAAFLHISTLAEVRAGKALRRQVDNARLSDQCLTTLHGYVRQPSSSERPPRMELDPIDRVLIMSPGEPRSLRTCSSKDGFMASPTALRESRCSMPCT